MKKKLGLVIWVLIALAAFLALGGIVYNRAKMESQGNKHPVVTFELADKGNIKIELYPEYAPNTVANFVKLVQSGYYNNKVIYGKDEICLYAGRDSLGEAVNPKLSLIDSSVEADSENDYEFTIEGEFYTNGFEQNTLRHEKGIITLIRNDYTQYVSALSDESYNSGNAQIGIMMSDDSSTLNGVYAAFGKVIEGMEILEKIYTEEEIAPVETTTDETADAATEEEETGIDRFATFPVIKSASVETHGVEFGMPEIQEAFDYESYMNDLMSQYYGQ